MTRETGPEAGTDRTDGLDAEVENAVRLHSRLVFRIAYSVLRSRTDAEDATQEVFLRILRSRERLPEVRDMKTYLARVAWRVALDRRPRLVPVSLDDEGAAAARELRSSDASAEELAQKGELRRMMERLVASLPRELAETIRLSAAGELTSFEVGEILGIPEGTVRTRLLRARRILKDALERERKGGQRA
ncbi:MAG TPA: RNA polymerase sigma factor [Thermoanaerobaculia bacterium]|nr:RNA polymerase sigma factor [Thermoanaerobaculia bacterium]